MKVAAVILGALLIAGVLFESFEAVVLPRRVTRRYRFGRFYYRNSWKLWRIVTGWLVTRVRAREACLSWFGPLSLLGLFALWFAGLIVGFGLIMWGIEVPLRGAPDPGLHSYFYLSGVTFFTLGFGDLTPTEPLGQMLLVLECGLGFSILALMMSYFPVLYQAFSTREVSITMLDARAGSPPSAGQLLIRAASAGDFPAIVQPFLQEWERWAANVLESHLSFPVLSYYRSQHDNQSWLAALTALLDACALLMTGPKECRLFQAQLTFAMARHAAVDLALVFQVPPAPPATDRLPPERLAALRQKLKAAGLELRGDAAADARLAELRGMYEPFVHALADYFALRIPDIDPDNSAVDNWQTSAWTRRTPGIGNLPVTDDHFD